MNRRLLTLAALITLAGWSGSALAQSPEEDVASEQRQVGGDAGKVYFSINPAPGQEAPEDGYGLLFVLPGGSGSAEFNPFVQRIATNAAPPGFLVVQLVAPKWTEDQHTIWPTERSPVKGQQFTTEEFIAAVLDDVRSRHTIDEDRLLLMGWSSSGPVVYAMLCEEQTPFDGFYICMSVFRPELMPPLENADRRRVVIEHSPEDRTCPFRMAEQARDRLTKVGAAVRFETYAGGHGWRGAIYPRMRQAFEFLLESSMEEAAAPAQPEAEPEEEPVR